MYKCYGFIYCILVISNTFADLDSSITTTHNSLYHKPLRYAFFDTFILATSLYVMFTYNHEISYIGNIVTHLTGPFDNQEKMHHRAAYLLFGYLLPLCSIHNIYHCIQHNKSSNADTTLPEKPHPRTCKISRYATMLLASSIVCASLYRFIAQDDEYWDNTKTLFIEPFNSKNELYERASLFLLGYILPWYGMYNILHEIKYC